MSEAFGHFEIGDERHEMTPENTSVFMHLGQLAVFDHVFTFTGENSGAYIWREHQHFQGALNAAIENECAIHMNLRKVAAQDEKVYMDYALGDVGETVPEDW